jgi:hypothetical protein
MVLYVVGAIWKIAVHLAIWKIAVQLGGRCEL